MTDGIESAIEGVESMPLTATPLADALARAEEGVRYWTDLAQAEARDAAALRARVAELEVQNACFREGMQHPDPSINAEVEADVAEARRINVALGIKDSAHIGRVDWQTRHDEQKDRAEKAEAERDDERDKRIVAEVDRDRAHGAREVLGKLLVERDALRAQVEAARTYARQALDYGEDCDATDLLAAMDEAKP